jgi:short-subunit dehydrogenase
MTLYYILINVLGHTGVPYTALYSSTKHALHGFFNSLRIEFQILKIPIDITICIIGATDTEGVGDIKNKIKVTWHHPRNVAHSIVSGAGHRVRELYHPHMEMYPSVLIAKIFPQLMEKILGMTMSNNS